MFIGSSGCLAMARLHFLHRIEKRYVNLFTIVALANSYFFSVILVNCWPTPAYVHWL